MQNEWSAEKNTHKRTFKLKSFEKRNNILISSTWSTGFHKEKITEMASISLHFVLFFFNSHCFDRWQIAILHDLLVTIFYQKMFLAIGLFVMQLLNFCRRLKVHLIKRCMISTCRAYKDLLFRCMHRSTFFHGPYWEHASIQPFYFN